MGMGVKRYLRQREVIYERPLNSKWTQRYILLNEMHPK